MFINLPSYSDIFAQTPNTDSRKYHSLKHEKRFSMGFQISREVSSIFRCVCDICSNAKLVYQRSINCLTTHYHTPITLIKKLSSGQCLALTRALISTSNDNVSRVVIEFRRSMPAVNVNRQGMEEKGKGGGVEKERGGRGLSMKSASVGTIRESNANAMNLLWQVSGLVGGPKAHSPV